jgi:hypothetical protein
MYYVSCYECYNGTYAWYCSLSVHEELCDAMIHCKDSSTHDKNKLYKIDNIDSNPVLYYMNGEIVRVRPVNCVVIGEYAVENVK